MLRNRFDPRQSRLSRINIFRGICEICEKARLREDSVTPNQQERLELESRDPWMMNRNFIYKSRIARRRKIFISGAAPSRTIFSDEEPRNRPFVIVRLHG